MSTNPSQAEPAEEIRWQPIVAKYAKPHLGRSLWQVANTLIPYFILWGLMIWSIQFSYWITLALAPLAAGFLMRTFIIFHDCGHGSFYVSRRANDLAGMLLSLFTPLPYHAWRRGHALGRPEARLVIVGGASGSDGDGGCNSRSSAFLLRRVATIASMRCIAPLASTATYANAARC